jgi:hypothetical protein
MLNLKHEEIDVGIEEYPAAPMNREIRQDLSASSSRVATGNALTISVQYPFSFDVRCSAFDVGRSSLKVVIDDPVFFIRLIPAEPMISYHTQKAWVSMAD